MYIATKFTCLPPVSAARWSLNNGPQSKSSAAQRKRAVCAKFERSIPYKARFNIYRADNNHVSKIHFCRTRTHAPSWYFFLSMPHREAVESCGKGRGWPVINLQGNLRRKAAGVASGPPHSLYAVGDCAALAILAAVRRLGGWQGRHARDTCIWGRTLALA